MYEEINLKKFKRICLFIIGVISILLLGYVIGYSNGITYANSSIQEYLKSCVCGLIL